MNEARTAWGVGVGNIRHLTFATARTHISFALQPNDACTYDTFPDDACSTCCNPPWYMYRANHLRAVLRQYQAESADCAAAAAAACA